MQVTKAGMIRQTLNLTENENCENVVHCKDCIHDEVRHSHWKWRMTNYAYVRAIDLIKRIKTEETHEREIDRHKTFDLAINALEKQIPKKVNISLKGTTDWNTKCHCPNCHGFVSRGKYCTDCGQALDWGDTNGQT